MTNPLIPDKCPACGYAGHPVNGWSMSCGGPMGRWVERCHRCGKDYTVNTTEREETAQQALLRGIRLGLEAARKAVDEDYNKFCSEDPNPSYIIQALKAEDIAKAAS